MIVLYIVSLWLSVVCILLNICLDFWCDLTVTSLNSINQNGKCCCCAVSFIETGMVMGQN